MAALKDAFSELACLLAQHSETTSLSEPDRLWGVFFGCSQTHSHLAVTAVFAAVDVAAGEMAASCPLKVEATFNAQPLKALYGGTFKALVGYRCPSDAVGVALVQHQLCEPVGGRLPAEIAVRKVTVVLRDGSQVQACRAGNGLARTTSAGRYADRVSAALRCVAGVPSGAFKGSPPELAAVHARLTVSAALGSLIKMAAVDPSTVASLSTAALLALSSQRTPLAGAASWAHARQLATHDGALARPCPSGGSNWQQLACWADDELFAFVVDEMAPSRQQCQQMFDQVVDTGAATRAQLGVLLRAITGLPS